MLWHRFCFQAFHGREDHFKMSLTKERLYMKKTIIVLISVLIFTQILIIPCQAKNGVDDLRGQWNFELSGLISQPLTFKIFINDIEPDSNSSTDGVFVASGCMQTPGSESIVPMALRAESTDIGVYNLSLLSTVIPPESMGNPFVIQILGSVQTLGRAVSDDTGGGDGSYFRTEFFEGGKWVASHHDRRRTKCPPVDDLNTPGIHYRADVYAIRHVSGDQLNEARTILEGSTNIVSTAMLVERPDGSSLIVAPFTDIFSPTVDFISEFRYLQPWEELDIGDPMTSEHYTFTLLDALGKPIPGTTKMDKWTGCDIGAPRNLNGIVMPNLDIDLSWDSVDSGPGFDPANGLGFYQIAIRTWPEMNEMYGSSGIQLTNHIIPWTNFFPPAHGQPDGDNFGQGLEVFSDGNHEIWISSFSIASEENGGSGLECNSTDLGAAIFFKKEDDSINFIPAPW